MEHYSILVIHATFMPIILCLIEVRLVNSNCIAYLLCLQCVYAGFLQKILLHCCIQDNCSKIH